MQLHSLTFAALGPFRDEQHIDFAELAAGGLFLLEGPTGAGKSTIIDAVVFALYGQVAGGNSSLHRLVSDHRDPRTEPFVDLTFETGRGVYRVRRTPAFERLKKRGEGTTPQQATVKLWKGTSPSGVHGDPISTRAGEADDEIRDAIGLSREQFVRTVVLPQGEFARFLQSKSDERRDILQSIFGTEHYERVQAELKRRRVEARKACDDADADLRYAVTSFADAAGHNDDELTAAAAQLTEQVLTAVVDAEEDAETALTSWTDEIVARLESAHQTLDERRTRAEAARTEAHATLKDLEQRRERRDRLRAALAEKQRLEADRDAHDARAQRLDAGLRAATCRVAIDAVDAATAQLEQTRHRVEALRATVELPGLDVTQAEQDEVATAHRALLDDIVALNDVLKVEADLPHRRDELTTLREEREKLSTNLTAIETRSTELPKRIQELEEHLAAARDAAVGVGTLREERRQVADMIRVHHDLVAARQERESANSHRRAALRLYTLASENEADLRRRYLESVAAELAEALPKGKPCQVCGSRKHPRLAQRALDHVDREEVDEAEQQRLKRQQDLDDSKNVVERATTRVAELEGKLDGRTAEELEARLAEIDHGIAKAQEAEERLTELTAEIAQRKQELEDCHEQHRRATADIAAADARIAAVTEAVERDEARVAEQRHGFSSVAARAGDLKRRATAADQLVRALSELDRHAENRGARLAELNRTIAEADFDDVDAARAALVPAEELETLRRQVEEWRRRLHAVEGRLAEPDLDGIDPDAQIDVDHARAELDAREAELAFLQREVATSADRLQRSRRARRRVAEAISLRRQRHAGAAAVIRMAGLANADINDNALRMPLATYVLQRVFDNVVDAANERLVEMSAGRYTLDSYDGKQAGTRRTGLGLHVIDAHTGHARDTGTLSGGETFYVSLSLALGLADVVTSQAGGMTMNTLFIDEGFGSLDPDTLDDVMGVLADLRSGGRVVGIVSHVDELKTRIPERIEVRRASVGGPSTLTVTA
ncbi:AAA family ATPase [Phytoactinopolyspora halotolerans]|uniref:Nuclease SbcCD subunit C n=1 Tax=Phytoactinopolyspora halotolerans TaxID=1981512 RepID=A0A6L9SGS8_9ACTN|nr:SMC family ATPase [Phytoactinopolyspora halotolerans]NEE04585.1 SMC family ATPase [Phytoactinopolyspora halotolerans]